MSRSIREVLSSRSDFSPFLVHLTRGNGDQPRERRRSARRKLSRMLRAGVVRARNPHGVLARHFNDFRRQVPALYLRAFCLTDTPPEQLPTLIGEIWGRRDRLDSYGLVFSKRHRGVREAGPPRRYFTLTEEGRKMVLAVEVAGAIVS